MTEAELSDASTQNLPAPKPGHPSVTRIGEHYGAVEELRAKAEHILTANSATATVFQAAIDAKIIAPAGVTENALRELAEFHHRLLNPNAPISALRNQFPVALQELTEGIAVGSPHSLLVRPSKTLSGEELFTLYDGLGQPDPQRDTSHLLDFPNIAPDHLDAVGYWHYLNDNATEARRFWHRAADEGIIESRYWLGILAEQDGNLPEAVEQYASAASAGDTNAMNDLGRLLVDQDQEASAFALFEKAATLGQPNAMFNLASLYRIRGEVDTARSWYEKAADEDNAEAMWFLGLIAEAEGELNEAIRWFRQGAESGYPLAMFHLASHVDPIEAEALIKTAIELGLKEDFTRIIEHLQ